MRFFRIRLYVVVSVLSFLMLICPKNFSNSLRERSITTIHPLWQGFKKSSFVPSKTFSIYEYLQTLENLKKEKLELQKENKLLSSQLFEVQKFLFSKDIIENDFELLKALKNSQEEQGYAKDFLQRRYEELKLRLMKQIESVDAKVIYREPSSWSSSLWIDKGSDYNDLYGLNIIAENSPVIIGDAIVGVIEYVGKKKSKVKLITDDKLSISVRAIRGSTQNRFLLDNLLLLIEQIKPREDLFFSQQEHDNTLRILSNLSQNIELFTSDDYMAKGEIHGSSLPLWRCRAQKLKGIGFNYDFDDDEGPSRDLKTGRVLDQSLEEENKVLLRKGDLLVTTGMDGVFPAGFNVAIVTEILNLEHGSYYYDLKAQAVAPELDSIEKVSILAPLESF